MIPLTQSARIVLNQMVKEIVHLPRGYAFWEGLPLKGRQSSRCVLRRWLALLLRELYPAQLRQAALLASLDDEGVPDSRSRALYAWLLKVVYKGQAQQLHDDWYRLKQAIEKQPELLFRPKPKRKVVRPSTMQRQGMLTWHEYPPRKQPLEPSPFHQQTEKVS